MNDRTEMSNIRFSTESGAVYSYDGSYLVREGPESSLIDYANSPDAQPLAATLRGEITVGERAVFHLTDVPGHPARHRITTPVKEILS